MRSIPVFLVAIVLSACSASTTVPGDTASTTTLHVVPPPTTTVPTETPDTFALEVPVQIDSFRVKPVQVGDRELLLAIADDPSLRSQGLQGVASLGDLDGMLFYWRHDGDPFWMKDTLIPLDIVWFNEDGTFKGTASMQPCTEDPCPTYQPEGLDFRYAIEAPPGSLDWITKDTVIVYTDD